MSTVAKKKVAVIIPLYGYWTDVKDSQLDADALATTINRIKSSYHEVYYLYVACPARMPKDIQAFLTVKQTVGNMIAVPVGQDASYGEYVREGIDYALKQTKASSIVIINPWVIIQYNGIDNLIERLNKADQAKVISGFDISKKVEAEDFDKFSPLSPKEERDLTFDFVGMERYTAEMLRMDENYRTHAFVERDTWQTMYANNYEVITSERIPIFPFNLDWKLIEPEGDVQADKAYFTKKWGFTPTV